MESPKKQEGGWNRRDFIKKGGLSLGLGLGALACGKLFRGLLEQLGEKELREKLGSFASEANQRKSEIDEIVNKKNFEGIIKTLGFLVKVKNENKKFQEIGFIFEELLILSKAVWDAPSNSGEETSALNSYHDKLRMSVEFLSDLGYFFNFNHYIYGGKILIKIEKEHRVRLSEIEGLRKIFPKNKLTDKKRVAFIDDPGYANSGAEVLGSIYLNFPELGKESAFLEGNIFPEKWRKDGSNYTEGVATHESAHSVLSEKYHLSPAVKKDFETQIAEDEIFKIGNNTQWVHEFIAHGCELNDCFQCVAARAVRPSLFYLEKKDNSDFFINSKNSSLEQYTLHFNFFFRLLEKTLGKGELNSFLEKVYQNTKRLEKEYLEYQKEGNESGKSACIKEEEKDLARFSRELLGKLKQQDIDYIKNQYAEKAKILLEEIETFNY